jgi:hypothetical protein
MARKRSLPEEWSMGRGVRADLRDKLDRAMGGQGKRPPAEADLREAMSDTKTRQALARQSAKGAADEKLAYRSAMRRFQRYAKGDRGAKIPADVRGSLIKQARAETKSRKLADLRKAGTAKVGFSTTAQVYGDLRRDFGPRNAINVDAKTLADAIGRNDVDAVLRLGIRGYFDKDPDRAESLPISFTDVSKLDIEW